MLHNNPGYVAAFETECRDAAGRRRTALEATDPARVLRAAATGDAEAWSAIRARYDARVRWAARQYGLQADDIDEVAQATWVRLFVHIRSIRNPQALGAWLETTARRESIRLVARREIPIDPDALPDCPAPPEPDHLLLKERRDALSAALGRLPARHAALMRQLIAEPAPGYAEIARDLAMPIGSIGPIRARSLARLRCDRELADALT